MSSAPPPPLNAELGRTLPAVGPNVPERPNRGHLWLVGAAIMALAYAAQRPVFDRAIVPMDEGQLVAVAGHLLGGEVLYRDVYTGIFPGLYYFTAFLLDLFGRDVIVTRWAQMGVNAGTAVLLFLIGARAAPLGWALVAPVLYLVIGALAFPVLTMFNYSPLSMLFGLGALLAGLGYLDSGRVWKGVAAGLLIAACTLVKQNFGALVLIAMLLIFAVCRRGSAFERRSYAACVLPVLLAGLAVAVPVAAAFALAGALGILIDATLLGLLQPQISSFNNPVPPLLGPHPTEDGRFTFLYLPPALFNYLIRGEALLGLVVSPLLRSVAIRMSYLAPLAVLAIGSVMALGRWARRGGEQSAYVALSIFSALVFLGLFPSAIWSHLVFVIAPILALAGVTAAQLDRWLGARWPTGRGLWRAAAVAVCLGGVFVAARIGSDIRRWNSVPLAHPRGSLFVSSESATLIGESLRFIEAHSRPGDPIFVAPTMPILYFLAGRSNPTPYDLTIPGDVREEVIIERLEATRTCCIVYDPNMYIEFPPFAELFPKLDDYLRSRYRRAALFRSGLSVWEGWVRND